MRTDGLSTVTAVADFLDGDVVDAVPGELRGEVRAAAKLLRRSVTELKVRHHEVESEIGELLALCTPYDPEAVEALEQRSRSDLVSQEEVRESVHEIAAGVMADLVSTDHPDLQAFLIALDRCAVRRLTWQAVFPVPEGAT